MHIHMVRYCDEIFSITLLDCEFTEGNACGWIVQHPGSLHIKCIRCSFTFRVVFGEKYCWAIHWKKSIRFYSRLWIDCSIQFN